MAKALFTNNAKTTLSAGISNSDLSLAVAAGTGALFPAPTAGNYFMCYLVNASTYVREIIKVTARSTDTFTIERAQEGTTALAFSTSDKVELRVTSASLNDFLTSDTLGVSVQAYDADTAKTDVAQTFTISQRGTITTDNDGNFNQATTNNFSCTPTGAVALTFTNHTAGQSGLVLFVNTTNYAITAAATTYIAAADLAKLSATGSYTIAYISNGTNTYCVVSAALTSAGV